MLKIHQLGLITLAPLVATLIASNGAKAPHINSSGVSIGGGSASSRDLHAALGITPAGLYLTTASFAVFAPKISGTKTRGPMRKAESWTSRRGRSLHFWGSISDAL
jgi:hypothetical protein